MEEIYRQYSKQIYNYLVYISHDKDLAEELTQETFYRAKEKMKKMKNEEKEESWP